MRGGEKLCSTSVLRLRLPTYRRRFSLCIFNHRRSHCPNQHTPQALSTHLIFFLSFVPLQASVNLFYSFCVGKRVSLCGEKIKKCCGTAASVIQSIVSEAETWHHGLLHCRFAVKTLVCVVSAKKDLY